MRSFDSAAPLAAFMLLAMLALMPAAPAEQPAPDADAGPPDAVQVSAETPPALCASDVLVPAPQATPAADVQGRASSRAASDAGNDLAPTVCAQTPSVPGEALLQATRPHPSPAYRASIDFGRTHERRSPQLHGRIEPDPNVLSLAPSLDHRATRRLLLRRA